MSVMIPVTCVVRMTALDNLVITAFCRPIRKLNTRMSNVTAHVPLSPTCAPTRPNTSSKQASNRSGSAYSLCILRLREKLIRMAQHVAPVRKERTAPKPVRSVAGSPKAILSAMDETIPVMWEVYC